MRETNTSRLLILDLLLCSGQMAQWYESAFSCAGGMWSAGSNPDGATVRNLNFLCSYFFFIVFLLLGLFLFIRTVHLF